MEDLEIKGKPCSISRRVLLSVCLAVLIGMIALVAWTLGNKMVGGGRFAALTPGAGAPVVQGCVGMDREAIEAVYGRSVASLSRFELVPYESGLTGRITQINIFGIRHAWLPVQEDVVMDPEAWWIFSSTKQFDVHTADISARFELGSGESTIQAYYPSFEALVVRFDNQGIAIECVKLGPLTHVRTMR